MTIDEAIKYIKEDLEIRRALTSDYSLDRDLVVWLEELKAMKNLDKTNFSDGYNRAIDDFLKEANAAFPMQSDGTAVLRRLEKIADRLKGGGSSE